MSMKRLRKRSCCLFLIVLMVFTQIPFTANAAIYPDTANHWACSYIDFVTNKFIMTSPDGTYFYPSEPLTRIDAVKAAAKLVGATITHTSSSNYLDIMGHYEYAGYVNWADDIGIIDEYSRDIFGPEFEIDRETFCTMLYRLYNAYDYPLLYLRSYDAYFQDQSSISSWATEAIKRLYCAEVINGGTDGKFDPKRDITRAEACVALRNIYFDLLDASLTSVDLNDGHAPHNEYASTLKSYLVNSGYSSSKIKMKSYMTKDTFLEALAYSKIFVYKGHGSETFLPTSDDDMFGFTHFHKIPQNNGMAIADLVIFSGCNTAGSNKVYTSNSFTGQAYEFCSESSDR